MKDDRTPTIIYGAAAAVLGVITLIAALIWNHNLTSSPDSESIGLSGNNVIAGILIILGIVLIIYAVCVLLVTWLRNRSELDTAVPPVIKNDQIDDSLKLPPEQPGDNAQPKNERL